MKTVLMCGYPEGIMKPGHAMDHGLEGIDILSNLVLDRKLENIFQKGSRTR